MSDHEPGLPTLPNLPPEMAQIVLKSIHELRGAWLPEPVPAAKRAGAFLAFTAFTETDPNGQMVRLFAQTIGKYPIPPALPAGALYPRELLFQGMVIMLLVSIFGVPLEVAAHEIPALYKAAMSIEQSARRRAEKGDPHHE